LYISYQAKQANDWAALASCYAKVSLDSIELELVCPPNYNLTQSSVTGVIGYTPKAAAFDAAFTKVSDLANSKLFNIGQHIIKFR
jgi:hypothetical protein